MATAEYHRTGRVGVAGACGAVAEPRSAHLGLCNAHGDRNLFRHRRTVAERQLITCAAIVTSYDRARHKGSIGEDNGCRGARS